MRSLRALVRFTAAVLFTLVTAGSFPAWSQGGAASLKIAIVAKSEANMVFLVARRGAEAAAQEQSAKAGVPIEIVWLTPQREDPHVQAERIAKAVADGAGGLLVACSDIPSLTPAINAAVDKGVPVMTFDSDAPGSKRFAFYGVDDTDLAEKLLGTLSEQLGGKGKIAILAGNVGAPNLVRRADAIKKVAAAQYPGMEVVEVVNHRETPAEAVEALLRVDAARPDLAGWAMVGGWPLRRSSQTQAMLEELQRRKLKVVAVDALPEQLLYVEKGLVPVLWAQSNFLWGKVGVETIVDKVIRKKPIPEMIRMQLVRVSRQNLGTWARQLQTWGFVGIPEDYLKLD